MPHIALIDATLHTDAAPLSTIAAGLTLLERALRLARVCGAERAIVVTTPDTESLAQSIISAHKFAFPIELITAPGPSFRHVAAAANAILPNNNKPRILWLRSSTIYDRGLVKTCLEKATTSPESPELIYTMLPAGSVEIADVISLCPQHLKVISQELTSTPLTPNDHNKHDFQSLIAHLTPLEISTIQTRHNGWQQNILTQADAKTAADRLWNSCRKPEDGIVSRHLNRHLSIFTSRLLAPTNIHPNQISIVTFSLGILAGIAVAFGGYPAFLLGAALYQINSIIDGVDGELARVKYEFSFLGEWLDTLSDDFSDLFFYIGLGIGAWRTVPIDIFGLNSSIWLILGAIAAATKLLSMALYYRWLIANKRGDLLAFQWSFETPSDQPPTLLDKLLHNLRYLFRKDFIVFASLVLALFSALPWLLFLFAIGNLIVAISVAIQQIKMAAK